MKWLYSSALVLLLFLVGCGGGGGGTTVIAPVQAAPVTVPISTDRPRIAKVDYRFDQPNGTTNSGYMVTSFEAIKPIVDNIKSIGFNGVQLQLEAPVNLNTAQISFTDYDYNRSVPKDLWRVVDYIHSQGLTVTLLIRITDSVTDIDIASWTKVGTAFSVTTMLNNVAIYDQSIAQIAEQHKVEYISIGAGNMGIDAGYDSGWQNIVTAIKSVYTGKIMYSGYLDGSRPVVYKYVDVIGVMSKDVLSNTPVTDVVTIMGLYRNTADRHDIVSYFKDIKAAYNKPVWYEGFSTSAADVGVNKPINLYDQAIAGAIANSTLVVSFAGQVAQIQAFFETINGPLANTVDGLSIGEFSPWGLASWIQNSTPGGGSAWIIKLLGDYQLTTDSVAQSAIKTYLTQPWGYHTIN
jgi:hypothetical protein